MSGIPVRDWKTHGFDTTGGKLGETPILWEFKMQYHWSESVAEDEPDWDQCCTCWEFAISEGEARAKVWSKFEPPSVKPESIKSCKPVRFENDRDRELAAKWAKWAK
jgi:hypothetical protein